MPQSLPKAGCSWKGESRRAASTDLPVHISHGVLQGLQVVHQVVLQLREHLPGVCLLQSDHHGETGQRKMRWGWGLTFCFCQPDGHCRRPGAPTSSERLRRPWTQPGDSLELDAEGPIASYSTGGSYGVGGGAEELTSSMCFTWSSVLLLAGDVSSREKAKGQRERESWQQPARAAGSSQRRAVVGISYHAACRGGKRQDPHGQGRVHHGHLHLVDRLGTCQGRSVRGAG